VKTIFNRIIRIISAIVIIQMFPLFQANAYMVKYKEDYYRLYHVHYQQYPDDCIENIYWLEKAVQADFCNPLYSDIKITNKRNGKNTAISIKCT